MIRACLLAVLVATPAVAQDRPAAPVLDVTFEETEAIPGQPLSLRMTVLVPTYMPEPPVWPSLEAPNLLVRLPEGSTNPTSERVEGETWAGVTRHYRISPMVPGNFSIPPQQVIVTWADPETNEAVRATLTTEPIAFSGVVPEGAEGLDPFVAARSLELIQEVEGNPEAMHPGDSVKRTVTAKIGGTSPMFLPALLPSTAIDGVAAYPDEPAVAETDDRGTPSGTRTESVTYVAEGGGSGEVPPISLDWYNLDTGEVETASADGFAILVDGPPARAAAEPRDWRALALAALAGLILLALALWLIRRAVPPVRSWLHRRREARLASEGHAWDLLRRAVERRDHAGLHPALDTWATRVDGPDPRRDPEVERALAALGAARYGRTPGDDTGAWRQLRVALTKARLRPARRGPALHALPPLNPGT